jgi:hypothetical protein
MKRVKRQLSPPIQSKAFHTKQPTLAEKNPIQYLPLHQKLPLFTKAMQDTNIYPTLQENGISVYVFNKYAPAETFLKELLQDHAPLVIGMDTETTVHFGPKPIFVQPTSTIQLSFGCGLVAIFQIFRICNIKGTFENHKLPNSLIKLLERPSVLKVGVGLSSDIKQLQQHYPLKLTNTIDIDSIASSLKLHTRGLAGLTYIYCNVELDKRKKLIFARWDADLKDESIRYAALDALYSREVYLKMIVAPPMEITKEELKVILDRNK